MKIKWVIDQIIGDVIDMREVVTDLKDIPISEREQWQSAQLDSLANNHQLQDDDTPIGKRVL